MAVGGAMDQPRELNTRRDAPDMIPLGDERIRAQLARILSSHDFNVPERVRAFLTYVTHESLADRAERIKGYTIAVEVFGRPPDFDMSNDPSVRIEAGRLRRALERYYLLEGADDPVLIDMPKGGYVPRFSLRATQSDNPLDPLNLALPQTNLSSRPSWDLHKRFFLQISVAAIAITLLTGLLLLSERPIPVSGISRTVILVKPFENLTRSADVAMVATQLSDEVITALSAKQGLAIFPSVSSDGAVTPSQTGTRRGKKRYLLQGAIREVKDKIRISIRLVQADTGQIVWSNIYDSDLAFSINNEADMASKISASVSQAVQLAKAQ